MVAHILLPAEDSAPASLSARWIRGVLRTDLNFQGAIFTDDLSMGAVAAGGDIVARCERALGAGCDMLLVCNDPPSRAQALSELKASPDPASQLRLVRMRGRERLAPADLRAAPAWSSAQQLLAQLAAAPSLSLTAARA
jgi:beta-N-acetylhexosaminidase